MSISNMSPRTTLKDCSAYKIRSNTYAYRVDNGIYINLTNRCTNDCVFCLRNNGSTAYGSNPLWLEKEPTAEEVIDAVDKIFFSECETFVFCGYGEPTCRLKILIDCAKALKTKYNLPIRLNTNGHSELINHGEESTELLFGLVDKVSISLNSANSDEYDKLCKPVFGSVAYNAMLKFGEHCVGNIPEVVFSVVEETLSAEDIEKCRTMVEKIGAKLRVRKFISENDQNPEGK